MIFTIFAGPAHATGVSITSVSKSLALEAQRAAQAKGRCISVSVVDAAGQLLHFDRMECAPLGSIETSKQKARSAIYFQKPTSDFAKAAREGNIGILSAQDLIAVAGGIPLSVDGQWIGAIGIGGATSTEDEAFGLEAIKMVFNKK